MTQEPPITFDARDGVGEHGGSSVRRSWWKPAVVVVLLVAVAAVMVFKASSSRLQEPAGSGDPLDRALTSGRPVLAHFTSGERIPCIHCMMMKPILDEVKKQYAGKVELLIIELAAHTEIAERCGVKMVPTQIFFDASGKETYRQKGFMARESIVAQLKTLGVE